MLKDYRNLPYVEGGVETYIRENQIEYICLLYTSQNQKTAWHCSDIPFVFHNTELVPVANIPGVSDRLEEQIFGAVMAFARTGKPEYEGLPQWLSLIHIFKSTIFSRLLQGIKRGRSGFSPIFYIVDAGALC